MASINKLPLGYLGFLGIKNGGEYPSETSRVLSPVWDMTGLYTFGNSEVSSVLVAIAAIGSQAFVTVPNGEAWLILQQSAACDTLGAGQTIELQTNWTDPASLVNIETGLMSGARTVGARATATCQDQYYAGPGSILGVNVTQLVAGPVNVRLKTRFARFSI
jgi:hypothetical protein